MEFIWDPCALAETPQPRPPHLGSYTWALLVSQDRHRFVTPFQCLFSSLLPATIFSSNFCFSFLPVIASPSLFCLSPSSLSVHSFSLPPVTVLFSPFLSVTFLTLSPPLFCLSPFSLPFPMCYHPNGLVDFSLSPFSHGISCMSTF
jgi:hypothetical protein